MGYDKLFHFKDALRASGAVISGSFVLQCILGEYWPDSDIDFFVPDSGMRAPAPGVIPTSALDNYLFANGEYRERGRLAAMLPGGKYTDLFTGDTEQTITLLRDYWLRDVKFQMVHVNKTSTADVANWIETGFDFDIVKNSVWIDPSSGKWQWRVADWDAVLTKSFIFQSNRNLASSLRRRDKYEQRGFEIKYADPRPLIDKWSFGCNLPDIRFVDFRHNRPAFISYLVRDRLFPQFNRDFRGASLLSCEKANCFLHLLSCWHMHGPLDCYGNEVILIDKDVPDIPRITCIVMALQGLRIPTLVFCEILKHLPGCNTAFCKPARLWDIVKTIKNFKSLY